LLGQGIAELRQGEVMLSIYMTILKRAYKSSIANAQGRIEPGALATGAIAIALEVLNRR